MKHDTTTLITILITGWIAATAPANAAVLCIGDCDRDGVPAVAELLTGVGISLGRRSTTACAHFDPSADGQVTIDELVAGIGNALDGCPRARAVTAACEVPPPPGSAAAAARCGFLVVPEHRERPFEDAIEIAYMVVPSAAAEPAPDPIVYIDGGPGFRTLDATLPLHTPEVVGPYLAERDLIYFDARGVGRSRPALECPGYADALLARLAVEQNALADAAAVGAAARACHDELVAAGIDPSAFTSDAVARDVSDLVAALGYRQYNVIGTSYGSRIATVLLRDVPAGVRSVVLDLPIPVQANVAADQARNVARSLGLVTEVCAASPGCAASFPDLAAAVMATAEMLDGAPLAVAGAAGPFVLTGGRFLEMVEGLLSSPATATYLPAFVGEVATGGGFLTLTATGLFAVPPAMSLGVHAALGCGEQIAFLTPPLIAAAQQGVAARLAQYSRDYALQSALDGCVPWIASAPAGGVPEAVRSDVPALILAGELDPTTPPEYGALMAETLSRGQVVTLPATGHFIVDAGGCGGAIAAAFIDDPTAAVDTSCTASIPPLAFIGF